MTKEFKLPEGEYSSGFIQWLAMAIHCEIIEPEELTRWFSEGKSTEDISVHLSRLVRKWRMEHFTS